MVEDYKWWEVVIAWLKKEANFLSDPRTVTTIVQAIAAVWMMAKMLGWVTVEFSDQQIITVLQTSAGLMVALAALIGALAAIVVPAVVLVKSWENRPSRSIKPWLTPRG